MVGSIPTVASPLWIYSQSNTANINVCHVFSQLSMMVMKPEVKDRIVSHEHPVIAAIFNRKFNQVMQLFNRNVLESM